ncbi:hypothetical protein CCH79_00003295, partial [Gambusia affinis]
MAMALIGNTVATVGGLVTGVLNFFTDFFLTPPLNATLMFLEEAELKTLKGVVPFNIFPFLRHKDVQGQNALGKVGSGSHGSAATREAAELSSLKPQLDKLGVPLYAVVKEDVGTEVQNFRPYFKGEIFLDEKRRFYGPRERKMGLLAFMRLGVWLSGVRAFRKGFIGNVLGEGFVLGGVFVIGRGQQGILLEHREKEFGDKVNISDVLQAVRKIP